MLVIFDCDGVLVDSEPLANGLLARYVSDLGLPMTREESVDAFMGRSWAAGVELIEERLGRPVPEDFSERYHAELYELFERELRPVRGIEAALDAIRSRCASRRAARTSGSAFALRVSGLLGRFTDEQIFSASDVAHGKPAPDLFLHAAATHGLRAARLRRGRGRPRRRPGRARRRHGRARLRGDGGSEGRDDVHLDGRAAGAAQRFRSQISRSPVSVSRSSTSSIALQYGTTAWASPPVAIACAGPTSSVSRSRMPSTMPA